MMMMSGNLYMDVVVLKCHRDASSSKFVTLSQKNGINSYLFYVGMAKLNMDSENMRSSEKFN